MLFPIDPYLVEKAEKRQRRRYLTEAEFDDVLKQTNPPRRRAWSRRVCRLLYYLGHSLTRIGERLEHLATSEGALTPGS